MRDLVLTMGDLDPNVLVPALLTFAAAVTAGFFTFLATRRPPHSQAPPPAPTEVPPSKLAGFSGSQNEFMALVIEDSKLVREELAHQRREVSRALTEIDSLREERGMFERAVRRYLEMLAGSWPGPETMPWPAHDDLGILERTLPRPRRPRT